MYFAHTKIDSQSFYFLIFAEKQTTQQTNKQTNGPQNECAILDKETGNLEQYQ